MVETNLRLSPLGPLTLGPGLEEMPFSAQINLRGNAEDSAFMIAVREVLGAELPTAPNRVASGADDIRILWLGPDEWLIVAAGGPGTVLSGQLGAALSGQHVAITDVSANRVILRLAGPHALSALMKSCDLDLHPRAFAPGHVVQTMIAKSQAILEHNGDDGYHIYVRCSFARYMAEWFCDALAEYQD